MTFGCAKQPHSAKKGVDYKEDLFILLALDSQNINAPRESTFYYHELYKLNKNQDYLLKAIYNSFKAQDYFMMKKLSREGLANHPKNEELFLKELIISLFSLQEFSEAIKKSKFLLKKYPNYDNYEIVANVYYAKKDYQNALKHYESSYSIKQNENTLIKLTNILYSYLNQKDVALAYLETYLQSHGCTPKICDRLMIIYQEQGNINGMLSILNRMHTKYKQNPALTKTVLVIENIIVSLLEKKDIKLAIEYLEKNKLDQVKLLNLYYQNSQLKEALKLTRKLYRKTKSPELLGRIAMIEFEMASDKQKVMKHVTANFELALSSGINNASYQNFYGYLLIDYNINVKKGISLVRQALKQAPKNLAYLDSLAWGYYKLGKCKESLKLMSQVIQVTGTDDKEIKMHWEKIKNCKEKNKK